MEKIQEQLLFNFGEINNLTKGLEARILYESRRNQAIDYFAEQNDDNLSTATLEQMLLWVSKVQKSPIYHPATVAEKLCKIPQLLSRLRKGDESVVQEVALAFSTRNDNRLTRPQMTML